MIVRRQAAPRPAICRLQAGGTPSVASPGSRHVRKRMGELARQLVTSHAIDLPRNYLFAVAAAACIGGLIGRCDIDHESGFVIALSKNAMLL